MRYTSGLHRLIQLFLVGLILVGGTVVGTGEATAQTTKKKKKTGTITVLGATTKEESCDGSLLVSIKFVRKTDDGDKTRYRATTVDNDGLWSVKLSRAKKGDYAISATLVGHPDPGIVNWDAQSFKLNGGKKKEVDLGKIRISDCDE